MVLRAAAVALVALTAAGCVATDRPTTSQGQLLPVEAQKREVAELRERGVISYEEAARRQFQIQSANYALTEGEYSFWRASIEYAQEVDRKLISKAKYSQLVNAAYKYYVVDKKTSKPLFFKL